MKVVLSILLLTLIVAFASPRASGAEFRACQLGRRDPSQSIPACTLAIGATKDRISLADAYYNRGIAYAANGKLDLALNDLNRAIKINDKPAYYFEDRAEVRNGLKDFDAAIGDFNIAIRKDPKSAFRYQGRGYAFQQTGNLDAALKDFTTAIEIDPRDFRFFNRGVVLLAQQAYQPATTDFDETIRRNPKFAIAYGKRALAYLALGQPDRAIADADRAIEIDPKDAQNFVSRALVSEKLGKLNSALQDLQTSLLRNANDPDRAAAYARVKAELAAKIEPPTFEPHTAAPAKTYPHEVPTKTTSSSRVALVIGNTNYANVAPLPNAIFDAQAIAQLFRQDGFDTVEFKSDVSAADFRRALADFELLARTADVAVIYFSGHGIEVTGKNYLVPVDAKLERDVDVEDEAIPLDRILRASESAHHLKLVILDACRNDPFRASMRVAGATRSIDRGLARVDPESNTLVAYAAAAGTIAQDGAPGTHSPFTEALLNDLATPGRDIRLALGKVRDDVVDATKGSQEPYTYGSLGGNEVTLARPVDRSKPIGD